MNKASVADYLAKIHAICRGQDVELPFEIDIAICEIDSGLQIYKRISNPNAALSELFNEMKTVANSGTLPMQIIPTWVGYLIHKILHFNVEPLFTPQLPPVEAYIDYVREYGRDITDCFKLDDDSPDGRNYQHAEFIGDKIFSYAFTRWIARTSIRDEKRLTEVKHYYENTQTLAEIGLLMGVDKLVWGARTVTVTYDIVEDCVESLMLALDTLLVNAIGLSLQSMTPMRADVCKSLRNLAAAHSSLPIKFVDFLFSNFDVNTDIIRPDKTLIVSMIKLVRKETKKALPVVPRENDFRLRIGLTEDEIRGLASRFGVSVSRIGPIFRRTYIIKRTDTMLDIKTAQSIIYMKIVYDLKHEANIDVYSIVQAKNADLCADQDTVAQLSKLSVALAAKRHYVDVVYNREDISAPCTINIRPRGGNEKNGIIVRLPTSGRRITMDDLTRLTQILRERNL